MILGLSAALLLPSTSAGAEEPDTSQASADEAAAAVLEIGADHIDGLDELDAISAEGETFELSAGAIDISVDTESVGELEIAGVDGTEVTLQIVDVDPVGELDIVQDLAVLSGGDTASTTVVQATSVGPRVMTLIETPDAPTTYSYDQVLPDGATVLSLPDGSLEIRDSAGELLAEVPAPWAVDAAGAPVPANYDVDGWRITMNVGHNSGFVYPIVADPFWWLVAVAVVKIGAKKLTIKLAKSAFDHIVKRHGPRSAEWEQSLAPSSRETGCNDQLTQP